MRMQLRSLPTTFLAALLGIGVTLLSPSASRAEICTIDNVPAATLLFPYFEVDLKPNCNKSKLTTLLAITNAGPAPALAHVVVWTNWSVPVLDFNIALTGYDVETIDLNDILCRGDIPGSDSPVNDLTLRHYQAWLSGQQSPLTSACASESQGAGKLVGYVTVDVVNSEVSGSPVDGASYFNNVVFDNVLTGDYYFVDGKVSGARRICGSDKMCARKYKQAILNTRGIHGAPAVAIEAAAGGTFVPTDRTFYGRYLGADASDRREPLPYTFHVRYDQVKKRNKFDMIVWREGNSTFSPVTCGESPNWHPLNLTQLIAFDTQENPIELTNQTGVPSASTFVNETQAVSNAISGVPYSSGWLYFNFGTTFGVDDPYSDGEGQAWVVERRDGIVDSAGVTALGYPSSCP